MSVRVITEPPFEPVSVAQAATWCRIDSDQISAESPTLRILIAAARRYAEEYTGRAFVQRSLQYVLPGWGDPSNPMMRQYAPCIVVPQPPLIEVTSITYLDGDGVQQTLAANQYTVHTDGVPGLIVPARGVTWPGLDSAIDAVRVNFKGGYAPVGSPTDEAAYQAPMPAELQLWMQTRVSTFNEYREQLVSIQRGEIPSSFADVLLDGLVVDNRFA